jgi:hypothetical protein
MLLARNWYILDSCQHDQEIYQIIVSRFTNERVTSQKVKGIIAEIKATSTAEAWNYHDMG